MPQNVARGAQLGWRAADAMWRAAGDTATDYNHYTKRDDRSAGVYAATIAVFLEDESEGHADTRAFLGRRIENIMRSSAPRRNGSRRPSTASACRASSAGCANPGRV
jgi:ubiquinone biosynthesis protein COQ9